MRTHAGRGFYRNHIAIIRLVRTRTRADIQDGPDFSKRPMDVRRDTRIGPAMPGILGREQRRSRSRGGGSRDRSFSERLKTTTQITLLYSVTQELQRSNNNSREIVAECEKACLVAFERLNVKTF
ncbi:hypothetical protein [Candidatus Pollutiaquabacter sp.]|uniref:hypothetical protein n=1 Tax=Candidatus Pollutiaquabacter sp. TaxID=3416354 RepID=UPI003D13E55B